MGRGIPGLPDPAGIGEIQARFAEREPSGEPEAGAEGVEAESPEGEDWLDAVIDEARTAKDRQRSRGVEMGD